MGVYLVALLLCSLTTYLLYRYIRCNSGNSFFDGKHVLITGGSSGIGLSLAILARRSGANITLIARNRERLKLARETLASTSTTRSDAWVEVRSMDLTSSYASPVDVLIHSAGFCFSREFREMPIDEIASMNHTNYLGPVHLTHILLPSMLSMFSPQQNRLSHPARERRIAFISSMGGQVAIAGLTAYSATKYAIRGFADALRMELDMTGPLVTTSFPPDTDTPGFAFINYDPRAFMTYSHSVGSFVYRVTYMPPR
ncbi:unnamed protein product [Protopolystoma xenopodis]|uniref:3-ketodihydrosphingosine reductase n=1 Tax=Protopolystoma xenopodis TaxID=117903 RepID=A0A3S5ADZ8_9PLAT|nr:unnamed protein product [Protopolystoma xenopodis]